jgi:hypothetical protein
MPILSKGHSALLAAALIACTPPAPDLAADRAALLHLHAQQREAHLGKDAALLTATFADTFLNISRGRVASPTRAESTARLQAYFDRSTFIEWDDIVPPIVRISRDGQMASLIVQKRVRLTAPDSTGTLAPEHTVFAWLATYEKMNGTWRLTAVASTDRPGAVMAGTGLAPPN